MTATPQEIIQGAVQVLREQATVIEECYDPQDFEEALEAIQETVNVLRSRV